MIDFRYHLVSLISVFLALAVGIVLGAGPLREGIGDTLTGQVEELRTDRDQLRTEVDDLGVEVSDRDSYIASLTAQVAAGSLDGQQVALVALPEAVSDDVDAAESTLQDAGAQVALRVSVAPSWQETTAAYRQSFAGQVAGYLTTDPPADADPDYVLAAALAQLLVQQPDAETASLLTELLTAGDTPFLEAFDVPGTAVDAVVVIGPHPEETADDAQDEDAESESESESATALTEVDWVPVVSGLAAALPTVTVGAADGLIGQLRAAALATTTLDSVGEVPAMAALPLAVNAELRAVHGAYGSAEDATQPAPPLPEAIPEPEAQPDEEQAQSQTEDEASPKSAEEDGEK